MTNSLPRLLLTLSAVLLPMSIAGAQTPIPLPQNIDDTTFGPLLSGNTYVANQPTFVPQGRTLTVQADVVVKFASNTALQVAGTIDVNGTAAQPVWFTSTRDDAVGLAVDPLPPAPGDWRMLQFVSTSTSELRGLRIRFGGGGSPAALQTIQADILLDDVAVTDSAVDGFDVDGSSPTVQNCRFDDNASFGIADVPMQALPGFLNNTASGNGSGDAILCNSGTFTGTARIGPQNLTGPAVRVNANVTVATGAQLTIDAGVILKHESSTRFIVNGTLLSNGTPPAPVVFTSIADDAIGGDTANDGPTVGAPGDWDGVTFSSFADASELRDTTVRFAGDGLAGGIRLLQANILMDAVAVERSLSDGLDVGGNLPTVRNCRFDDNLGYGINRVPISAVQGFVANTATGNVLGDAIRCTNADVSGSRTIDVANLIDDTLVVVGTLSTSTVEDLTVGPGVIFKWENATGVSLAGPLVCNGTQAAPVVFTSLGDDAVGGDTANDGPTVGMPGDWRGLSFGGSTDASVLRFTTVRFGGASQQAAVQTLNGADILIEDAVIERSATIGLAITGSLPTVRRSRFDDNVGRPVDGLAWTQIARMSDCTASGNGPGDYTLLDSGATGGTGTSSRIDKWNTLNGDGVIVATVRTNMNSNTDLQLGAGLILKFTNASASGSGLRCSAPGATLLFDGRGYAPIVLTSFLDDEHGGDTNGDGSATAPAPGAWGGVQYDLSAAASQMNHVLARFGGVGASATVVCDTVNVSIDAVRVELSASDGFDIARVFGGLRNLVAFGNQGDGIVLSATANSLMHATVAANVGRGIVTEGSHTGACAACISWFNGANANDNYVGFVDPLGQPVRMFFSNGSPAHAGTQNCFVADPLFTDPGAGDLTLSLFSPCVGTAGVPNGAFTFNDHVGNSRVLDHNLFGFALPDMGAYEYFVYGATIDGAPRLGATITFRIDGQPFQGNPPGICLLAFGGTYQGIATFTPPYGNALILNAVDPFFVVTSFLTGTATSVTLPNDQGLLGQQFGLQTLALQLSNIGTGNWTTAFFGTIAE